MTARGPGLRERTKRARRGAIIDAAQRLVREHGYDAVTTGRIAAEAGVSPRTFFNYFESKDQAVVGLPPDFAVDRSVLAEIAAGGPGGSLPADLRVLAGGLLEHLGDDPARVTTAAELVRREPRLLLHHVDAVERHRAELMAAFEARREAVPGTPAAELLMTAVAALARAATLAWIQDGGTRPITDHLPAAAVELAALLAPAPAAAATLDAAPAPAPAPVQDTARPPR